MPSNNNKYSDEDLIYAHLMFLNRSGIEIETKTENIIERLFRRIFSRHV